MARPAPLPAEDVALARKVLVGNAAIIALCPAPPLAGHTWPVLERLGRALRLLATAPVGLVRAQAGLDGQDVGPPTEAETMPPDHAYRLRELDDWNLVELILPRAQSLGEAAHNLELAVKQSGGKFAHLIIDFDRYLPDVRELAELPDAFVSVASAGRTRQRDLKAMVELLPASRHLGTLLVE
jgi:hypothetical protein